MDKEDAELIRKTNLYEGFNKVDNYKIRFKLFDGSWSTEIDREVFERRHGVLVMMFDAIREKVVLVEQFRFGAFAALSSGLFDNKKSPWTLECVAGNIDEKENPREVAIRETKEETNCDIKDLISIGHFLISPSSSNQSVFMFCANVDSSNAKGIHGNFEEGEHTRPIALTASEAFHLIDSGQINTAATVLALQWLKLNYKKLIVRWA